MDLQQMMHGAANGGVQLLGVNVATFTFCAASLLAIALPDGIPVGGGVPGLSTILSLFIVLFVLPGLLYLLDGVIQHTTLNLHFYKVSKEEK